MNGDVVVESMRGAGSTFTLTLPAVVQDSAPAGALGGD
jgi:signal transduction histidine kinase